MGQEVNPVSDGVLMVTALHDPARFAEVFDRHFHSIHRYVARRVGSLVADDLAGETFRVAFERRATFDVSRHSALPWLYGIATNLLRSHHRTETRRLRVLGRAAARRLDVEDVAEDAAARADAAALAPQVARAVAALSCSDRDALVLVTVVGLSYAEAAEALRVPIGTVRSRINRARKRLRELVILDEQEPTEGLAGQEDWHG